jgi:hypothetical protein
MKASVRATSKSKGRACFGVFEADTLPVRTCFTHFVDSASLPSHLTEPLCDVNGMLIAELIT